MDTTCAFIYVPIGIFSTYEIVSTGVVVMENSTPCLVVGTSRLRLKLVDEIVGTLDQVRYAPD